MPALHPTGAKRSRHPQPVARLKSGLRRRRIALQRPTREIDWRHLVPPEVQHGNTCLTWSRRTCIELFMELRGAADDLPRLDPFRPYWYARRRHREHDQDGGTYARSAWWAGDKFGEVPEPAMRDWRARGYDPIYDDPPGLLDLSTIRGLKVRGEAIFATGAELVWRIADSLMKRQPVQLSLPVDEEFGNNIGPMGPILPPTNRAPLGHAMAAVGCRPRRMGAPPDIYVANTWGVGWRDGGSALLSAEYVAQSYACYYVKEIEWQGQLYS